MNSWLSEGEGKLALKRGKYNNIVSFPWKKIYYLVIFWGGGGVLDGRFTEGWLGGEGTIQHWCELLSHTQACKTRFQLMRENLGKT